MALAHPRKKGISPIVLKRKILRLTYINQPEESADEYLDDPQIDVWIPVKNDSSTCFFCFFKSI